MNIKDYLQEMKKIHTSVLNFIDTSDDSEVNFHYLIETIDKIKIHDDPQKLKPFLYLLLKISSYHQRKCDLFSKIERIIQLFKDDMKKYYTNSELFHIFESNKRILLYLFEEKIIVMDKFICDAILNNKSYLNQYYREYFSPEISPFLTEEKYNQASKELPEDFYENRKNGENENYVCKLIRNDSLDDFISFFTKYSNTIIISSSIYETSPFLLKKYETTYIEYAAFYGSIKIFNYLKLNNINLSNSIWEYAIHGNNAEIINILEENEMQYHKYKEGFKVSIRCHHDDLTRYFQENYKYNSYSFIRNIFKYYNFNLMQLEMINQNTFGLLCLFDYSYLINLIVNEMDIDINEPVILFTNI